MLTVNFYNFNSLRLFKGQAPFEQDQGKCKWDLVSGVQRKKSCLQ